MAERNGSEDGQDQHDQNSDGGQDSGQKSDQPSQQAQKDEEARKKRSPFIRIGLAVFAAVLVPAGRWADRIGQRCGRALDGRSAVARRDRSCRWGPGERRRGTGARRPFLEERSDPRL